MKKIMVCVNRRANPDQPSCAARGAEKIAVQLETEVAQHQLPIVVERFYCLGLCDEGPNLRFGPHGRFFNYLTLQDVPRLMVEITAFADANCPAVSPDHGV